MGLFTWTDARSDASELHRTKDGRFFERDKIGYLCEAKVVCPDDYEVKETFYRGYGIFGGYDVYEMVVDWNKEYLYDLMIQIDPESPLFNLIYAFQKDDRVGVAMELERLLKIGKVPEYYRKEWKRNLGIILCCAFEEKGVQLPYPIKITKSKRRLHYEELYPSVQCQ